MYNGIGLTTARGSGTNGHVQRNFAFVRQGKKDNMKYKTEDDLKKLDALNNRPPNEEILEHDRKRKIELKCLEFEEILEDQNYPADEIAAKVQNFREKLLSVKQRNEDIPKDEFGRFAVRETHQVAAAQQEKNAMLRSAFGISEYFVEGSSFDADRKGKEELAKSEALQKELEAQRALDLEKSKQYRLVRTPSKERETENSATSLVVDKEKSTSDKKTSTDKKIKKNHEKSKSSRSHKKKKSNTSDESSSSSSSSSFSSSSDEDSAKKKIRRKQRKNSSSDASKSDSDEGKSKNKKLSRRDDGKHQKKKSDRDSRKSKKTHKKRHNSDDSSDSESNKRKPKRSRKRKHSDSSDDTDSSNDGARKQRKK